jgi:glycosyltransferase involved in cell wall biosynthesis
LARRELARRGIEAQLVRNAFDLNPASGDRAEARSSLGFAPDDVVVLQPTRAIPRKEVSRGIAFATSLQEQFPGRVVRYWLTGPAEDGFGAELAKLVANARVPVIEGRAHRPEDAYAAADVVVFPSSWEGFGNPVIEATIAGKPIAVAHYPVLDELVDLGLQVMSIDNPASIANFLQAPDSRIADANRACLRAHFDLKDLPSRLHAALASVGWDTW